MAVIIKDVRITNELSTGETPFLLGNIGDKITIEIDIDISENVIATSDFEASSPYLLLDTGRQIRIRPLPEHSDEVDNDDLIWSSDASAFQNFRVDDIIILTGSRQEVSGINNGSDGNYKIIEKIGNQKIRVVPEGPFALQPLSYLVKNANIALFTPVAGVSYAYNFIENDATETFDSLIDGELQLVKTNDADASDLVTQVPLNFRGKSTYQLGDATIIGKGVDITGKQSFTITHNTVITPFFLDTQLNDFQNLIAPDYYLNNNSLSYVLKIKAGRNVLDENSMQDSDDYERLVGNVGWFNENFNGNRTEYSVDSFSYDNGTGVDVNNPTVLSAIIKNTTDSPFVNGSTNLVANFVFLSDEANYTENSRTLDENFFFDRSLNVLGSSTAGDNFGTDFQIISDVTSTFVSASEIQVDITFDLASSAKTEILERIQKNFVVFVSVQDHTKTVLDSDRVALFVDGGESEMFVQLTEIDLIDADTSFLQHTSNVDTIKNFCAFPTDDIIAKTTFSIDFTGRETEGIKIIEVQNRINLIHATETDIVLDEFITNVSNQPLNGLGQYINVSQDRNFKLDSGDIRKTISITSEPVVGNVHEWTVLFPFINRFEYWESLNLNTLPNGLFDPLEPNNGLNHYWFLLASNLGWSLSYELTFLIEQNGEQFEQSFNCPIDSVDFNSNADWSNEIIQTFKTDTVTTTNLNILGFEDTYVKADFEYVGATVPDVADVEIVFSINTFEQGGINTMFQASSVYEFASLSPFKSIDTSNKVVVTEASDVFTGEVLIDYTKIKESECFTIYSRIYDKRDSIPPVDPDSKLLENGEVKCMENSEVKIIE